MGFVCVFVLFIPCFSRCFIFNLIALFSISSLILLLSSFYSLQVIDMPAILKAESLREMKIKEMSSESALKSKIIPKKKIVWNKDDEVLASSLAKTGNLICLTQLFDAGYDVSLVGKSGVTLAMTAAREGNLMILNLLMSKELDFSVRDSLSRTVMHHAATCQKDDVMSYLLTHEKTKICTYDIHLLFSPIYCHFFHLLFSPICCDDLVPVVISSDGYMLLHGINLVTCPSLSSPSETIKRLR